MCCLFFNGDDGHNHEYNNDNNMMMNANTHSHLGTSNARKICSRFLTTIHPNDIFKLTHTVCVAIRVTVVVCAKIYVLLQGT